MKNGEQFLTEDGWNETRIDEETGLMDTLDQAARIQYELNNCRRGSYALDGDTVDDLKEALEQLASAITEAAEAL